MDCVYMSYSHYWGCSMLFHFPLWSNDEVNNGYFGQIHHRFIWRISHGFQTHYKQSLLTSSMLMTRAELKYNYWVLLIRYLTLCSWNYRALFSSVVYPPYPSIILSVRSCDGVECVKNYDEDIRRSWKNMAVLIRIRRVQPISTLPIGFR